MRFPPSLHTLALIALLSGSMASIASARPARPAPPLPPPAGSVVNVATEAQLQAAMQQIASNTTILIAPGTYVLTRTLYIHGNYVNVGIRGATDNADDVVLVGPGMAEANYGAVPFGIWTGDGVTSVTIANLTIRDFYFHPIIFNGGTQSPLVHNVHLINSGQQFIKVNPDAAGLGANNGILEYSVIEYPGTAKDDYTKGIDIQGASNWVIRHNLFRNIVAPPGQIAGPGILAWRGSSGTTVEGNTFLNCARGVMFGADDFVSPSHRGGVIRNNFFYRSAAQPGDVGIIMSDSPESQVLNNTVLISGTYRAPIEIRYRGTTGGLIANNLMDGAIGIRDGATATDSHNIVGATAALFVAPTIGDLHLAASAGVAIDQGLDGVNVADDWDGEPRPSGAHVDIGADEYTLSNALSQTLLTTQVPAAVFSDGVPYELGTRIVTDVSGQFSAVRFWKATSETAGTHVGNIWTAAGQLLATVTFTNETASGWQQQALPIPLAVVANAEYVVSVNTVNYFVDTQSAFTAALVNGHLRAPAGANGVFAAPGAFPTGSYASSNYFRDVVFISQAMAPDAGVPIVSISQPASGATVTGQVTIAASAMDDVGVAGVQFQVDAVALGGEQPTSPYSTVWDSTQATNGSHVLTAIARDAASHAAAASVTVTVANPDQPAQTLLTTQTPAATFTDGVPYELGVRVISDVGAHVTAIRFWKTASETLGIHVGHIWSAAGQLLATVSFTNESASGWQQQALATPLAVNANVEYVVSVNTANFFPDTQNAFGAGLVNGHLRAVSGANGVFGAPGAFLTASYASSNYFRDVVFIAQ